MSLIQKDVFEWVGPTYDIQAILSRYLHIKKPNQDEIPCRQKLMVVVHGYHETDGAD